jgi:phenylalanyl-tRNA synthetase beta chain
MKVSYNWLKQYIKTDLDPTKMGEILTETGLEVESVEKIEAIKGGLEGVVIGEVLACEKHPDADKLKVTTVNVGTDENLQIVCGAPNVAEGQKVIVATVGTTLYPKPEEAFKIKKSKIRGVESLGMLCAEDELGLGQSHDGILVLDSSLEVGMKASTYFELEDDYEIEIGLTPNRADAMGHIGVARDLVAYLNVHQDANLKLNLPDVSHFKVLSSEGNVAVSVANEEACPRYMGTTISNVKVGPSPAWLQKRLRSIGLSPINNVVDATNFVMRELGTPLHAFDAAVVQGKIEVKYAQKGDKFTTLDGVERELTDTDLMITNGSENLCLAGILGGLKSGVSDQTKTVFLEAAYFNPVVIRKSAKHHGLNTDASFRFERGVDPDLTAYALKRVACLIQEIAGGSISMEVFEHYPTPISKPDISFSLTRCKQLIGIEIPESTIQKILAELDIQIVNKSENVWSLKAPNYRVDVTREADIIEEILRIYGFNKVPLPEKLNSSILSFSKPDIEKVQVVLSEFLVGKGYHEILNNSLTSSTYVQKFGGNCLKSEQNVQMLNPLSQDLDVMRQSMLFNTLEVIRHNQNRQSPDLKIFEFGKTYHKYDSGYSEGKHLTLAVTGKLEKDQWNASNDSASFYTIKGLVMSLFKRLGLDSLLKEKALEVSLLEDGIELIILKQKVGEIGWVSDSMKKHFGIKQNMFVADLNWDMILSSLKMVSIKYTELPKTFEVRRDFSLLLNKEVSFSSIETLAQECDKKLLKQVSLFDVYEGKNLPEGKKSYAVSFAFQDNQVTLKDAQIDAVMNKIRTAVETKLGAQLR